MSVEIYIDDLKPDIQRQVLEELGLETAEDGNYDIIPLFSVKGLLILILFNQQCPLHFAAKSH